ncbi:transforming acidic coiled-coil-containing protein 3 isoform X2 [Ochotona princeps]|uniref:transforming acidic coiled-coil-containing protein 3 isoform X2 n=1 Tax=Ochotona princeps TaxID=9978 RepID=UPI002714F7B6|nr:transforming acidic coiled-coil-containing protein 3 isoform X2 [Ochotona princeps]
MSLQVLSDENLSSEKSPESCNFLFSPPEPSGRSAVLRLSQKENVPPRSLGKAVKVTFQTPLRDPQTHRILTPGPGSCLQALLAVDDSCRPEGALHIPPQSESHQLSREADAHASSGTLQRQAVAEADPLGTVSLATEDPASGKPGPVSPSASSSPQSLGPRKDEAATPAVPGSPHVALQGEGVARLPDDRRATATCKPDLVPTQSPPTAACRSPHSAHLSSPMAPEELHGLPGRAEAPLQPTGCLALADGGLSPPPEYSAPTAPSQASRTPSPRPQKEAVAEQAAESPQTKPCALGLDVPGSATSAVGPHPYALGQKQEVAPGEAHSRDGQPKPATHLSQEESPVLGSSLLETDRETAGHAAQPWEGPESSTVQPEAASPGTEPATTEPSPPSRPQCTALLGNTPEVQMAAKIPGTEDKGVAGPWGMTTPTHCPGGEPTAPTAQQLPEPVLNVEEESFRDPAEALGMDAAEVDYLEQFGTSSFKESAWRKQSLYLNFDPLLRNSPRRLLLPQLPPAPAPEAHSTQVPDGPSGAAQDALLVDLDLLGPVGPSVPLQAQVPSTPPGILQPGDPPVPVGPVVDLLQYSQRELDAAVEAAHRESQELRRRCEELQAKNLEMGKIMDGFEAMVYQAMEEGQKQKELAKAEVQKALKEKALLAADLSSMEKSFSDLFRRFEKQKEAIEGYHKNEEVLKKCVQDYLARIEKEAQRYQALKAQASEKLQLVNEELAQVRSKAQAEALAFQASLRKAQMQIESLEKAVEQKGRENEELTRICDDLISKMEKISGAAAGQDAE